MIKLLSENVMYLWLFAFGSFGLGLFLRSVFKKRVAKVTPKVTEEYRIFSEKSNSDEDKQ
ncbi:hypothetical protein FACS189425_11100 [Clostridia bacterium]|nr:hypothetical protein FACS189425_11100 [Clostridia bacterium]